MANNVVGSLLVNLGLETGRLNSDTKKAANHFNSFEKRAGRSLGNVRRKVSGLMGSISAMTGVAGVLSVAGLGAIVTSSLDAADKVGKLSARLGASTEALSQYQHVAELSGIKFNTLTMGWQRMTRRVAEAAQGTGEAKNALIELNVSAQDLNQLKPEEQFEVLADALMKVENQADRVRLSMKLFDSEGVSLLQTMTKGAAGIREMREEAHDLGLTLSQEDAAGAAAANDAFARLKTTGTALGLTLARELGPGLADIATWLSVHIPGAVQFAVDGFRALRHFALETVKQIALGLAKHASFFGKLPGILGKPFRIYAQELTQIATKIDTAQVSMALAIGTAKEFKSSAGVGDLVGEATGGGTGEKAAQAAAKERDQLANRLNLKLDMIKTSLMTEEERLFESLANRQFMVEEAFANELITEQTHQELLLGLEQKHASQVAELKKREAEKQLKLEQQVTGKIASMRQGVFNLSVGLLRTLGQDNKSFAVATILLEKGLNIARATQNTAVAVTKALAVDPTGSLASRVSTLGAVQVGLIAATGLAQISNLNSGAGAGGSFGGGAVPVSDISNENQIGADGSNDSGREITIRIVGGGDEFTEAVARSIEIAEANDRIRIINNA